MTDDGGHCRTIAGGKGGCAKTTTVVNTACALARLEYAVVIVDADPANLQEMCNRLRAGRRRGAGDHGQGPRRRRHGPHQGDGRARRRARPRRRRHARGRDDRLDDHVTTEGDGDGIAG